MSEVLKSDRERAKTDLILDRLIEDSEVRRLLTRKIDELGNR